MQKMAESIRSLRQKNQMTQAQLAERLGVQYQTVSKWENGRTVPDTALLPEIADALGASIDELFGRRFAPCTGEIPACETEFLLKTYSQMYAPEAGPWNLSAANKYLEYRFAEFFERHFEVAETTTICNIGIGAGEWDQYLSYRLKGGSLTSIDRLEICCRQLEQRLRCEGNPNDVRVICADAMTFVPDEKIDIVTMVGSTGMESGDSRALLERVFGFAKPGGAVYYQSLDSTDDCSAVIQTAFGHGMRLDAFFEDDAYDFCARYYKFGKI